MFERIDVSQSGSNGMYHGSNTDIQASFRPESAEPFANAGVQLV